MQKRNIDIILAEDMYQRIQELSGLNDKTDFLYKQANNIYFCAIPEAPREKFKEAIDEFINFLSKGQELESCDIRFSIRNLGEEKPPLDPKAQAIIEAWEKIERKFGVTVQDLEILLSYRVQLSRLHITSAGSIILSDFGKKEVKMDNLTKSIYFYYLNPHCS